MKCWVGVFLLAAGWLAAEPVSGVQSNPVSTMALARPEVRHRNASTGEAGSAEVPEPATLGLIGTGLAVASLWGRVRRRTEA